MDITPVENIEAMYSELKREYSYDGYSDEELDELVVSKISKLTNLSEEEILSTLGLSD